MSDDDEKGYFVYRPACSKCGRFVAESALRMDNYRANEGWNGAVDDVHDSHPKCGTGVLVAHNVAWVKARHPERWGKP